MAFLKINNYTVSVAPGSERMSTISAGARGRSPNNNFFVNQAGSLKRQWSFETTPMTMADAQGFIGMLEMRGEHFKYGGITGVSFYGDGIARSQKGRSQTVAGASVRTHSVRAADGALVYLKGGALAAPYQEFTRNATLPLEGCWWPSRTATNELSANNADPEDGTHLTLLSTGSLSTETNRKWYGAACVKWNPGTVGEGVRTSWQNVTATSNYVAAIHVRGSIASQSITLQLVDQGGANVIGSATNYILPVSTDTWTRLWTNGTSSTGVNTSIFIRANSADAFYVDGLSLQKIPDRQAPTAWAPGTTDIGTTSGAYDSAFFRDMKNGWTINFWCMNPNTTYTDWIYIVRQNVSFGLINIVSKLGDGKILVELSDASDPARTAWSYSVTSTTAMTAVWRMVTVTWDPFTPTLKVYINGVLEATDTTNSGTRAIDYNDANISTAVLNVGHDNAVVASVGALISNLSFLPYVASANLITGWYGTGASTDDSLSFFPLHCSGDFITESEESIYAFGQVNDVQTVSHVNAGVWDNNAVRIKFTLEEA